MNNAYKIIIVLILLSLGGCEQVQQFIDDKTKTKESKPMQMPPQMVVVMKAQKSDTNLTFKYPGRVLSEQDIDVRSKISGTLLKQTVKNGQKVAKGEKIFKIDPEVYEAIYNAKLANVEVAKANMDKAYKDYQRSKSLFSKKATSQKDYDTATSEYQVAKANLAQARAALSSAKINLNYTDVIAPFSGTVGDALLDVGDYIPANTPLIRLTSLDDVYAEFFIPDVQALDMSQKIKNNLWTKKGAQVKIQYQDISIDGNLSYIDTNINISTGQIKAKATFNDADNILPIGTFVDVFLVNISQKNAFKIPQVGLQQELATTVLYVVSPFKEKNTTNASSNMAPDGTVKAIPIKIDYQTDEFALVHGDLHEGDLIIMNNFKKIRPGVKVKIVGEYGKEPDKMEKK